MIRHAQIDDREGILKLLCEVNRIHAHARPDIFNIDTKYTDLELASKINKEPIFVYVDDNDNVLGYIFGVIIDYSSRILKENKTFFIDDFCVLESKRGCHIGTQLYEFVKDYAKTIGCNRITLNVWSFNEDAYKFYLKCGLKPLEITMEEIL